MKNQNNHGADKMELTRLDRVILHLRCLARDHKYCWHFAGIWREIILDSD